MKRILLLLTVALVMAAMMVASAVPAFASANSRNNGNATDAPGYSIAVNNCVDVQENQDYNYTSNPKGKKYSYQPTNCDHFHDY